MLPWYVAVKEDLVGLEMEKSGTYEDISRSHRYLKKPPCSPSGFANHYGSIPYRFPPSMPLSGLGALFDTLDCRHRWDSPLALKKRDIR